MANSQRGNWYGDGNGYRLANCRNTWFSCNSGSLFLANHNEKKCRTEDFEDELEELIQHTIPLLELKEALQQLESSIINNRLVLNINKVAIALERVLSTLKTISSWDWSATANKCRSHIKYYRSIRIEEKAVSVKKINNSIKCLCERADNATNQIKEVQQIVGEDSDLKNQIKQMVNIDNSKRMIIPTTLFTKQKLESNYIDIFEDLTDVLKQLDVTISDMPNVLSDRFYSRNQTRR